MPGTSETRSWIADKRLHFEYWPYPVFYFPMLFYGLWLALRSRSIMYFSNTNPGMLFGGVMGESKWKVLKSIPPEYVPKTLLIRPPFISDEVMAALKKSDLGFPLIAKPDRGERGRLVEKLQDKDALVAYLAAVNEDVLLQEYVGLPLELGILYYRYPDQKCGHISSIVQKAFLELEGDGEQTLGELVQHNPRSRARREYFHTKYKAEWTTVPASGERLLLEPIGNHNRGTVFRNANHLITPDLERVFDRIAGKIAGFHYGRFDIRVSGLEDLYSGKNIRILELNGVSSEPGHIYDPGNNLIRAWRDVAWHMAVIRRISEINLQMGHRRDSLVHFLAELRAHFRRNRLRKSFSSTGRSG